ncbi:hypothetical protein DRP07_06025 [Archaeoglobales archaeon]|nr:MAG: hypothetical protein DRP07_06025 [Archaeoglobales archaeon]
MKSCYKLSITSIWVEIIFEKVDEKVLKEFEKICWVLRSKATKASCKLKLKQKLEIIKPN